MKCKKCGGEISIYDRFCPNCGARNDVGASHADDMQRYESRFSDTEKDVKNKSGWFIKYITPIVVLLISVIMFFICSAASYDAEYDIASSRVKSYNSSHKDEINAKVTELLDNEEYMQVYMLYSVADQIKTDEGDKSYYSSWTGLYNIIDDYYYVKEYVMLHYSAGSSYYTDSDLSRAASKIYDFYGTLAGRNYSHMSEESLVYAENIRSDLEDFLRVYCKLTDEDIKSLADKDTTAIVALMTRRMINEE